MALVIPPGYIQCSIEIRNSGDPDPWYVTHAVDANDTGGDFTAIGEKVIAAFEIAWLSYLRTTSRVTGVHLTIGSDGGNYTLFVNNPNSGNGTSTADKLPQNCAYLVQKITARPGRAGKGRVFLPGVAPESSVDDVGVINPTALTGAQAACDSWLDYLAAGAGSPSLTMILLHNEGIPGGTEPSEVIALRIDNRIATQRRRLRR